MLEANPGTFQAAFALAILLGLRKNEVLALRRTDYDPLARTLAIRSAREDRGSADAARLLPVSPLLDGYLQPRVETSTDLLFPSASGGVRGPRSKLHERVRAAVKRAGLWTGYQQTCRRCGLRTLASSGAPSRCGRCDSRVWVEPVPRELTFLDLRATFARLADEASVPRSAQRYAMGLRRQSRDRDWSTDPMGLRAELERLNLQAHP